MAANQSNPINCIDQLFNVLTKSKFVELFGSLDNNIHEYPIVELEEIFEFIKDGTHQTPTYVGKDDNGFKFLSSKDVTTGKIDWTNIKYIPPELHEELHAHLAPRRNDILLAKNGTTGIAAKVDTDEIFDIYVSLALLRPLPGNDVDFLVESINSPSTKKQFDARLKGIGVPNLHLGEIKKTKILLPPIEKQKQYVIFVKKVEQLKHYFKQAIINLDQLVKSRFIEMIKSRDYDLRTIGDACLTTRVGPFGSALHKTEMVPDGPIFVLGTDNAVDNEFKVYEERYITAEKYAELERYTVQPGDIIITMMGTIGRSAVIPNNFKKSIISSHLSCLTVNPDIVIPEYMQKCMVLDHDVSKHLESNKKGSIMNGLNLKIIKAIPFSCPPLDTQKQFMEFVQQVDKSKFEIMKTVENVTNYRQMS